MFCRQSHSVGSGVYGCTGGDRRTHTCLFHSVLGPLKQGDVDLSKCMSQQLGNEVERQGKAIKSTTPRTALSFQRKEEELPWVGFEPTTLQSRRALYQLSHQGNSAGSVRIYNTTQHKANLKPLCYGTVNSHSVCSSTGDILLTW